MRLVFKIMFVSVRKVLFFSRKRYRKKDIFSNGQKIIDVPEIFPAIPVEVARLYKQEEGS